MAAYNAGQTGIFHFQAKGTIVPGVFPQEFRSKKFSQLEPRFLLSFAGLLILIGGTVFVLSYRQVSENVTQAQIVEIQERYASLVLNQPAPEPVPVKVEAVALPGKEGTGGGEKVSAEEAGGGGGGGNESVTEHETRRASGSAQRAAKRAAISKQISNVGIFAELTAAGGSGGATAGGRGGKGGKGIQDLIGDIDATQSLSKVTSAIGAGGGGFVHRKGSGTGEGGGDGTGGDGSGGPLRGRRGSRTEAGGIGASGVGNAEVAAVQSTAKVAINNVENLAGDAAGQETRSMKALNVVLRDFQFRLQRVYERYLKRHPDLAGKIVIHFTILPDGTVEDVKMASSELNDPALEEDLLRNFSRIKFSPASGKLTVDWPVVFSAS